MAGSHASRLMKRAFDVVAASTALVVLSPVIALLALAVRSRLGSPVLFSQTRPGKHGKSFTIHKFRTMLDGDGSDAERLTSFGQKLRATSLDELPELWNVVRGDMSLVGPRPLLTEYLPLYSERQATRHHVRPGLTGLAQVNGRNAIDWEQRLELDAVYVESRSMAGDIQILFQTVNSVIRRQDITADGEATMARFTGSDSSTSKG